MSKERKIPPGFASSPTLATLLACSVQNVRANILPRLGGNDVIEGRPTLLRFVAVLDVIVERRIAERKRSPVDDPLLVEGDSPGLERYRLAKASLAELDLAERKGQLIDVSTCRHTLSRWAAILRRSGERVARLHPEAGLTLSEALIECEAVVEELNRN